MTKNVYFIPDKQVESFTGVYTIFTTDKFIPIKSGDRLVSEFFDIVVADAEWEQIDDIIRYTIASMSAWYLINL